jgi:hypothetical protein
MKGRPIFIHSLFRTGSTYLWNKFRERDDYYCYYEPLHPDLKRLSPARPYAWDSSTETAELMRHPVLDRNKHAEYEPLLVEGHQGVPFFKDSFSYVEYCENGPNPDLKRYIDFLIEQAGERTPVLKFNRSALRIRWFKENYPSGVHLYLLRNPRDQWASYNTLSPPKVRDLFLATDLLIATLNRDLWPFKTLAESVLLIPVRAESTEEALAIYVELLAAYSQKERYLIFYYIWLASLLENLLFSDLALSIDLLCADPTYRRKVSSALASFQIHSLDFEDARIKPHTAQTLSSAEMGEIESRVHAMISGSMGPGEIERALKASRESGGLGLDLEGRFGASAAPILSKDDARPDPVTDLIQKLGLLGRRLVAHAGEIESLRVEIRENRARFEEQRKTMTGTIQEMDNRIREKDRQLSELNDQLSQTEKALSDVLGSRTFLVGKIALSPLQLILGVIASLRGQEGER